MEVLECEPDEWAFSERIRILGTVSGERLSEWLAPLQPDDVAEDPEGAAQMELPSDEEAVWFSVWWD